MNEQEIILELQQAGLLALGALCGSIGSKALPTVSLARALKNSGSESVYIDIILKEAEE